MDDLIPRPNSSDSLLSGYLPKPEPIAEGQRRSRDWYRAMPDLLRARSAFKPLVKERRATRSVKDETSGKFETESFVYADLSDVLEAVDEALVSNGFILTQEVVEMPWGPVMRTELLHQSGEWLAGYLPMPGLRQVSDPSEQAALVTLYRRYGACPFLGIAAEESQQKGTYVEPVKKGTAKSAPPPPAAGATRKTAAAPNASASDGQGGASPAAVSPDLPPAPPEEPQPQAEPQKPDMKSNTTARSTAARALRNKLMAAAKGEDSINQAAKAWVEASELIAALEVGELTITVDDYRHRFRQDPPAVEGVTYPSLVEG